MLPWLLLSFLATPLHSVHALEKTFGVQPHLLEKYTPLSGTPAKWKCLDGSKTISWDAVNDDYCDCLDGSDEPGTSACPNSTFYCKNEGHIGSVIRSSRVNDGLCEAECCDGSDEEPGLCPNICEKVGKEYRERVEAENKIRKKGSKIRSSYISFANKEKKRLEDLVASTSREVVAQEKEVARLKDIWDRSEATSAAELEEKKKSPLYQSLVTHTAALKALKRAYNDLAEKEQTLSEILSSLRAGYNPNYQDMAVLEAVRGYEHYAGLPPSNDRDRAKEEGEAPAEEESKTEEKEVEEEEELEEGEWTKEQLEKDLESLLDTDVESLLIEHDQHVGTEASDSLLFNLESYIPDSLIPQYELLRDSFVGLLETLGVARPADSSSSESTKTSKARTAYFDADRSLNKIRKEKETAQQQLAHLFDPEWFGADGEWKKLDGQCLEKDTGEYTYEVCLFGEARQKPNKGGSNFSLGKFTHWNNKPKIPPGSSSYYSKMYYTKGAKCWNGPERSVTLLLTCGTENQLLSVTEPEKCEYHITGTSPALCRPLEADVNGNGGSRSATKNAKEEL
ncbi:endoplasmic reticulum protein [Fomitiporia mediterranea MF3/22]|uniref:endoplasmic reticulum protein n=1 Tax=Fomitiporia mediterranea (strain MF3/22) TaxID=694068 RepID=UPI0004408278|nr:endoplasmic reticulum protein [Fomitiporia mediterranea MF3/22]EJD00926.1 endoplasmic reticulum protein [Fomitiporia mediterranea MF3/22]